MHDWYRNKSATGQKQVRNRSETGQKQVRNRSETGQKQGRNRAETGEGLHGGGGTSSNNNFSSSIRGRSETGRVCREFISLHCVLFLHCLGSLAGIILYVRIEYTGSILRYVRKCRGF